MVRKFRMGSFLTAALNENMIGKNVKFKSVSEFANNSDKEWKEGIIETLDCNEKEGYLAIELGIKRNEISYGYKITENYKIIVW